VRYSTPSRCWLKGLQQKNLIFAAERLSANHLHLVVGTEADAATLAAHGWDESSLSRLLPGRLGLPALAELRDELPEIATGLLTQLVEAEAVPQRHLTTAALNALRQHQWPGGFAELRAAVKSLALSALGEEIEAEDVYRLVAPASGGHAVTPSGLSADMLDLPLREAREMFERIYFEYHLALDGSNMTRLAEKTGLERTHLYRKLKDLGLR